VVGLVTTGFLAYHFIHAAACPHDAVPDGLANPQALVMIVVQPEGRTAAAAVTNAARCTVRPVGPLISGVVQQLVLGAPLLVAGAGKGAYDVLLWRWARARIPDSNGHVEAAVADNTTVMST
jgi:hypothetical protein